MSTFCFREEKKKKNINELYFLSFIFEVYNSHRVVNRICTQPLKFKIRLQKKKKKKKKKKHLKALF